MSRAIDVVRLSGDEYDRLMDEREILRQEATRAWREVDAIAKERDDHHRWRKELADQLGEVEKQRDVLARTVNTQEAELQALRMFAQEYEKLRAEAEIERLRADAERYRWLRSADGVPISPQAARDPVAYDAAIDAAIAEGKE
jgi:hypothetical protein